MMNQTEILKHRNGAQNKSIQNIQESSFTNQSSKITIIKANTYQINRDKTPKIQISSKQNSSGKLIRVNSSKGINVVSLRPSSTQKQIREFNSSNNISVGGSETTIKLDEGIVMNQMQQQLRKAVLFYEDKMNRQLDMQHHFFTGQIDRLKQIIAENQNRLNRQQFQLDQLLHRVETVQKKIQSKTNSMFKQLTQFKRFYDQCYAYTLKRVSQAEQSMKSVIGSVNQATSNIQKVQSWKYIQYANNVIKDIVVKCSTQTSSLKYYLNDQLMDLEMGLAKFHDQYEQLDRIVYDMKSVKFQNQTLKQCVKQLGKFGINMNILKKDQHKQNFLEYYQPKFKEIIKRVNNSAIQVDLVRSLIRGQCENYSSKAVYQTQKIEQLQKIIETLQKKLEDDKNWYTKQLAERQQVLNKSNPRILQLQTKLHSSFEQQAKMLRQISDLKLKVSYLQTKCQKTTERQFGIQSSLAEAFSEALVKEKVKKFQEDKNDLQKQIQKLQQRIRQLDHQNYLLAEKLNKNEQSISENIKLESELKFATKMISQYEQTRRNLIYQSQMLKEQKQQVQKKLIDQRNITKSLQVKINNLLIQRSKVDQDDQQYFDQLQQQVENNRKQIQRLESIIKKSQNKNQQLERRNQELQDDLHTYAETFQKQSITFRTALYNLQKQKDYLGTQNKKIQQQNKVLKMNLQQTKTVQSFYENHSNLSIQLRKTVSTDFGQSKPMKKLQRKVLSSKQKIGKVTQLKNVLDKLKCDLPVLCEIDATGHLKDQRTGCYFFDQNQNCFELDQTQLTSAIQMGLILL